MRKEIKYTLIIFACLIITGLLMFNQAVLAATPTSGDIYNLYNKASGKCLNVNFGTDANGTNVTQYTKDGSLEQRFKLVYTSARASYKLYAVCSSNGNNRVIDIYRPIQSGANVDIWTPNDNDAQDLIITSRGSGYYSLHPRYNTSLAITSYGTSNGSGAGTSPNSPGNVYITTYTGSNNQLWSFRETNSVCYWYEGGGLVTGNIVNTDFNYYSSDMGYKYRNFKNNNTSNFLNTISNSDIFVYYGHGSPAQLLGTGSQIPIESTTISSSNYSLSTLANGSLSNLKLATYYACNSGAPSSTPLAPSIVAATYNKGAKCVVGWDAIIYMDSVTEWNTYFLESLYNKNTIINAITKANTEIKKISQLTPEGVHSLLNNRVLQGDASQKMY